MAQTAKRADSLIPEETRSELYDMFDKAEREKKFLSEKELQDSVKSIRQTVKNEEIRLRQKFKFLKHQNLLGLGLFLVSFLMILTVGHLYVKGVLHWTLAIPLLALPGSILHELEHDLIHNMYFKSKQWVQHLMFFVIWWVKMSIPPWYRKQIHLRHHQTSGSRADIEERLIGIGLPLRALRWLLTFNQAAAAVVFDDLSADNPDFKPVFLTIISLPTVIVFSGLVHLYVCYIRVMAGLTFSSYDPALLLPMWMWPYVRDFAVIMVFPNMLRQCCLNLVATYCHYYGDVPLGSVFYQNQVIDHWSLWPLQLFSFNFGATHIIHHYIPNQPFYLRQMLAPKAIEELVSNGVRRNDFGVVLRNNRYFGEEYDQEYKFPFAEGHAIDDH